MLIYISFAMGFGNIPFILLGEVLPPESYSLGSSLVFISQNTFRQELSGANPFFLLLLQPLFQMLFLVHRLVDRDELITS
jgi:hypothetical protein